MNWATGPPRERAPRRLLAGEDSCDRRLQAVFLASSSRPSFLEAGVGKTEVAKVLASGLGRPLVRLQCYEGLDTAGAVYEWNYARQMIEIRLAEAAGGVAKGDLARDIFTEKFLLKRPLLQALAPDDGVPPVLLIDELDRTDEPFEAYLLEVLAEYQVTIPELGPCAPPHPGCGDTSNGTREIHDAIKRRALPGSTIPRDRELAVVRASARTRPRRSPPGRRPRSACYHGSLQGPGQDERSLAEPSCADRVTLDTATVADTLGDSSSQDDLTTLTPEITARRCRKRKGEAWASERAVGRAAPTGTSPGTCCTSCE